MPDFSSISRAADSTAEPLHGFDPDATLMASLRGAAMAGHGGLIHIRPDGEEVRQTYAELLASARRIGAGLTAAAITPGTPVLLQLELSEDFLPGLWGCIAAGAIPVPVAVGPTFTQPNSALQKLLNAAKLFVTPPVLASGAAFEGLRKLPATLGTVPGRLLDLAALRTAAEAPLPEPVATDVAVLLLTSGSTGKPKGVPLTHRNLLAMAAGTIRANAFTNGEVTLNWMALDHAGAVSFLGTMPTTLGCTQIHVPTGYILHDPLRWLDLISRHRATISWAPNFAFTLFLDRTGAVQQGKWDLRCMRFLVNAGESVVARTARRFITLLRPHGLPSDALRPAFGMSETCSGITWSAGFTLENTTDEPPFVDLGPCIPGASMRIVNEAGHLLPDAESGLLQLRGPSVFAGYYQNPVANAEVMRDGWFTTGDLAYVKRGCLYITGRQKDVIIVNGANFYCHEIESVAESVAGVAKTFTAAVAVRDAQAETDQLALFFCPETTDAAAIGAMARAIRAKLIQEAGVAPAYLVRMLPPELPKTEIGKIQRSHLRKTFESGGYQDRIIALTRPAPVRAVHGAGRHVRSELATAIAGIWQDVLGVETVGHDETFFELGGHSLLIVQVQARLQELIGRTIPIVELFDCPTVRTMAEHFAKDLAADPAAEARASGEAAAPMGSVATASRDIAIIGMGLRFPGAATPEEFWQVLAEGRETIRTFTAEEALAAGVDPALVRDPNHVKAAPMLDAPGAFDAEFFRYTAKEARLIDPQQRVFLEVCWEAFEDAGYDPLSFPGKVGLFAAAGLNTYLANNLLANRAFLQEENGGRMLTVDSMSGFNIMITNDKDYLPTRVSYKLNLRGPSIDVQTACSSTLVTLHQACNSLLLGDCEMALAGGVAIKLPQHAGHLYSAGMLNSPDGHCRAYDEKAEGTIFGNGAGVVLLKPLAAAQRDGDHIYAVVKATATNNDGAGKVGYTAPSAQGQEDVCAEALARAGVSAETITFVEGHGTGTPLGDPIEVNALATAFRRQTDRTGFCALGSVKTNIGHLQIASGIAGLIKAALALHHRQIPGTLHFEKPNPRIEFGRTPFFVNRETIAWASPDGPRRAGVNSLGIGGSNVHVILEEAPVPAASAGDSRTVVLPLSTRHPEALRQLARRYAEFLGAATEPSLEDIAFTAQVGRARLPVRTAFVAANRADLARQLAEFASQRDSLPSPVDFEQRGIAFAFGDGAIDASAVAGEPAYRAALDRCTAAAGGMPAAAFATQFALVEWLATYGIEPTLILSEGVGDYVAACRTGILTLEDALRLIAAESNPNDFRALAASISYVHATSKIVSLRTGASTGQVMGTADFWLDRAAGLNPTGPAAGSAAATPAVVIAFDSPDRGSDLLPSAERLSAGDVPTLIARLFSLGFPIDWARGRQLRPARRVALPTYPWQRQIYWIEGTDLIQPTSLRPAGRTPALSDPLLGTCLRSPRVREVIYQSGLSLEALPWLAEHRVHGRIVVPGALFLSQVARQAADLLRVGRGDSSRRVAVLTGVVFARALVIDPARSRVVQTVFTPDASAAGDGCHRFDVISFATDSSDDIVVHVTGRISATAPAGTPTQSRASLNGTSRTLPVAGHYALMDGMGIELGASFRWIREIQVEAGTSMVQLAAPDGCQPDAGWHPGLVDSLLQAAVPACELEGRRTLVPFGVQRMIFHRQPSPTSMAARAERIARSAGGDSVLCDVQVHDSHGALLVEVAGFELRPMAASEVQPPLESIPRFFELRWERPASAPAPAPAAGSWLLLGDDNAMTATLRRAFERAGMLVTVVPRAEAPRAATLLRSSEWRGVVCGWDLATTDHATLAWDGLLGCVHAAASRTGGTPPRWVFVTGELAQHPAQAPLAGFALGLAQEFPEWRPVHVEIDPAATDWTALAPWLVDPASAESRLVWREGTIQAARLVPATMTLNAAPISADGSYLITGGAGALGLATAKWLFARGARRIVLGGRHGVTPELKAQLSEWNAAGHHAAYVSANVADPTDVARLVAAAERLGPLRGVFHAAGQLSDGLLRQADRAAFDAVFESKVHGAWQLHLAVRDKPLDHFVLFSSVASLLGSPAQANYCAGNAFLDALAQHRRRAGLPGLSIQWGPWADVGMTARLAERDRQRVLSRGWIPMSPAAALSALEQVLGATGACVGVLAWDQARFRQSLGQVLPPLYARLFSAPAAASELPVANVELDARRDFGSLSLPARTEAIEALIRETVATILGLASPQQVDREQSLFDLGVDSLSAVDVKNRLEKALGKTLRATIAFDYPTASAMAGHLAATLFPPAAPTRSASPDELGALTTDELKSLLEDELAR